MPTPGLTSTNARTVSTSPSPASSRSSGIPSVRSLAGKGYDVAGYTFDICKKEQVSENISRIEKEHGHIDVLFNSYCFFRYSVDDSEREEKFFHKNERFKQAVNSKIRIWVSNAAAFSITIDGRKVELGKPGEVASKFISWEKDNGTGLYQLKIVPVY